MDRSKITEALLAALLLTGLLIDTRFSATWAEDKLPEAIQLMKKSIGRPAVRDGKICWSFKFSLGLRAVRRYLIAVTYENIPITHIIFYKLEIRDERMRKYSFTNLRIGPFKNFYLLSFALREEDIPDDAKEINITIRVNINDFAFIAQDKITRDKDGKWRDAEGKLLD